MRNQTSRYGEFSADTERSFYRWVIFFQNGNHCYGYSKMQNRPEISDKIRLLKRKIIMLTKSEKKYFDPKNLKCIEFYRRSDLGEYREHLFTMYPDSYSLQSNKRFNECQSMIWFLETVYSLLKSGNIDQLDYSSVGYSKLGEKEIFSLDGSRFKDSWELKKYCNDQVIEGRFPIGRIEYFEKQYSQLHFNK